MVMKPWLSSIVEGFRLMNPPLKLLSVKVQPDLIIVGGGIASQDDKKTVAKQMRDMMNQG